MLARNITIFKLPIDENYQNVFDFNDKTLATTLNYFTKLREIFPNVNLKGTNINDEITSINLEKEMDICVNIPCERTNDYIKNFISDYNYMAISTTPYYLGSEQKAQCFSFYFITGWKTVNSIQQTERYQEDGESITILFSLKWDAWANNLRAIQRQSNKAFFERKHIDDFERDDDKYGKRYGTKMHLTDEGFAPKMKAMVGTRKMLNREEYTVIFARVFFNREYKSIAINNETYFLFSTNGSTKNLGEFEEMPLSSSLNMACAYLPMFVIDTKTRKIAENITVKINGKTVLGQTADGFAELKNFVKYMGSYFYFCDLTVQYFGYIYQNKNINITVDHYHTFSTSATSNINLFTLLPPPERYVTGRTTEIQYFTRSQVPLLDTKDINKRIEFEPRVHYYPFEYFTIMCGQKTLDLKGIRGKKVCYIWEDSMGRMSPHFDVVYDVNVPPIYKTSSNFGAVTTEKDSYIDFMRQNKEKMNLRLVKGGLSSVSALLNSLVGKKPIKADEVLAPIANAYSQNLIEENSAFNSPDSVSINNTFAMDDLQVQDDLLIFENKMESEEEKEHIFYFFNLYGLNVNELDSFDNTRVNFDYQKTLDCNMQFIRDNADRTAVQNIFNNGVRRWHLDTCYIDAITECDTDYINLQNSLIES